MDNRENYPQLRIEEMMLDIECLKNQLKRKEHELQLLKDMLDKEKNRKWWQKLLNIH